MAGLELTREQIIEAGLALAGRPDLTSEARLWLNLFLEQQYMIQDWSWLVKSDTGLEVSDGVEFPSDYRAGRSAILVDQNGAKFPVDIIDRPDHYDYETLSVETGTEGQPRLIYANHDSRTFSFLPAPSQTYTMELKYYYIPSLPDHTDDSADEDTVKWGLPAQILIDHIKMRAYEYNDDQRYAPTKQEIQSDIGAAKVNNHDRRAGPSRIPFGKRFGKRFR